MNNKLIKNTLVNVNKMGVSYLAEIIEPEGKNAFLSISGSKKGSRYCGGGLAISDLWELNLLFLLIGKISALIISSDARERKVAYFNSRSRFFAGETKCFNGKWFYRLKVYSTYFKDKETGEISYFKGHQIRPAGRGFFIQEFDFPISYKGINAANEFARSLKESVETFLLELVGELDGNVLDLIQKGQVLIGGELPWFNSNGGGEVVTLPKPLFVTLCDHLRRQPLTPDAFASRLGLTLAAGSGQLNPTSRYDPRFLERGLLIDRVRRGFNSLHYLITEVPREAFVESPDLSHLFHSSPPSEWHSWIKTTFSNDEYSNGRRLSLHIAEFELEAFEGGVRWGIAPELEQLRTLAIRLFDLKRHFHGDDEMTLVVAELINRFISIKRHLGDV